MKQAIHSKTISLLFGLFAIAGAITAQQSDLKLPSEPLKFGVFVAQFDPAGTFTIEGVGWPKLTGNWKGAGSEIELTVPIPRPGCDVAGKYRVRKEGTHVGFDLVSDDCQVRRMIIGGSTWAPTTEAKAIPT